MVLIPPKGGNCSIFVFWIHEDSLTFEWWLTLIALKWIKLHPQYCLSPPSTFHWLYKFQLSWRLSEYFLSSHLRNSKYCHSELAHYLLVSKESVNLWRELFWICMIKVKQWLPSHTTDLHNCLILIIFAFQFTTFS